MDFSYNPMMKYMQYAMPVVFIFFFNSVAAGLSCYLVFSNFINIGQTIITRTYIIDQKKIEAQLHENKKKPKKKGGFAARLEEALNEQKRVAEEREKAKGKKK
jgi:YidC/Oxa1 family membrane protein insertase